MKKNKAKITGALVLLLIIIASIGGFYFFNQQTSLATPVQQIAIPHFASFKCEVVQDKPGLTYPLSGQLVIDKSSVGFLTNQITNIKVNIQYDFWANLKQDIRIRYKICDANQANCGSDVIVDYNLPGAKTLPLTSLDLTRNSLIIYYEKQNFIDFITGKWKPATENAVVSYDSQAFGLRLFSTTRDPAGAIICSNSCDLTCPQQSVRNKLIATDKNSLNFYETAPYLEYWESINYDLNQQAGATIYSASSNTFCLAGAVYKADTLTLENGQVYIYPKTATREIKQCCPGAVISTSQEDKICQSDYTWKVITKDTKIACKSDLQCPGQGLNTCQNKVRSGYRCGSDNFCTKDTVNVAVDCCSNSDCSSDQSCQNYKCVGGAVNPPINPVLLPNVPDTTCLPVNVLGVEVPKFWKPSCIGIFKQIQYAVSIILTLISLIIVFQLSRKLFFKRKKSKTDISLAWLTTIIISGLLAWLLFNPVFFWWGLVVGIGIIIVRWFIR